MLLGFFSGHPLVVLAASMSASASAEDPTNCRADVIFRANGDYGTAVNNSGIVQGTFSDQGDWVDTKAGLIPTLFEYNITKTSGSTPLGDSIHGDAVTWTTLPSSGEVEWHFNQVAVGVKTCELELQIREIADIANIDSITLTLTVDVGV